MTNQCPVCQYEIQSSEASCPQCGFRFSGATQEFKPIVMESEIARDDDGGKALLRVVRGPQVGAVYKLDRDYVTVGRNPQCDIFLNDMTVSRMHASLQREGNVYIINDVDSYNGVWVNDHSIDSKVLKPGDVIQIGKFAFVYDEN